jgi:hypothetical protein
MLRAAALLEGTVILLTTAVAYLRSRFLCPTALR